MVDLDKIKQAKAAESGAGKEKAPKLKFSKEQKLYVDQLVVIENRIATCREYIALWLNFFRFFTEDLQSREIRPEEEKVFFELMTRLARKHFMFTEMMATTFERGNDVLNVLVLAISLANLQTMNDAMRDKLELDWHSLYLEMNKTLRRLLHLLPGDPPLSEALAAMERIAPIGAKPAEAAKA